jgi:iron complex transport system substrate-binding protein
MIGRILLVCWALLLPAHAAAGRVADDSGQMLELARVPQRIVALAPHLTELLFAVGAGPQLVGVDSASDYPQAARALPRVGDAHRVNFERLVALKPDLVVVWLDGQRAADLQRLRSLGVPLLYTRAARLDDVAHLLRMLGEVSGHAAAGEGAAQEFTAGLAALKRTRRVPLPVFYQVWDRPLMTVGGGHWISEALALCGARNVFADLDAAAPVVSREAVLLRAPALVVGGSDGPDLRRDWQRHARLPAVRRGAFARVNADRLHRPSPRLLDGIAELCAVVDAYAR